MVVEPRSRDGQEVQGPDDHAARPRRRRRCDRRRGTRRSIARPPGSHACARRPTPTHLVRHVLVLEGDERDELPGAEVRAAGDAARTTSTPVTAPDTHLASSVWRRCSVRAAGRRRTARSRRRTSSSCGARTPARRIPIFFHHLLKGVHNGARLFVVDPRRTSSAQWADGWLGLDVGTDIALANTMAREIIHAGLHNRSFIEHATTGFEEYAASVEPYTLEEGERLTGVPAEVIRETAHAFARADRAMICWTLGITEHHNARRQRPRADQPRAAVRPRRALRLGPQPAARPEQRAGRRRHGRDPEQAARLPGHRARRTRRARASRRRGASTIRPRYGWHLTQMFHGMERGELRTLYVIGENPAQSEADINTTRELLEGLDFLVVQDIVLHEDRRVRRRRLPLVRLVVRGRGHRHQLGAARPARAQGARAAGRGARRHLDHRASSRAGSASTGASRRPSRSGTSCARSRRCTPA